MIERIKDETLYIQLTVVPIFRIRLIFWFLNLLTNPAIYWTNLYRDSSSEEKESNGKNNKTKPSNGKFVPKRPQQKFCSLACAVRYNRTNTRSEWK